MNIRCYTVIPDHTHVHAQVCCLAGISVFLSLVILGLVIYFVYKTRKHWKRMRDIEQTISSNEEKMAGYRFEINRYRLSQLESDEFRQKVTELNGRLLTLSAHNQALQEQLNQLGAKEESEESPLLVIRSSNPLSEDSREESFRLMLSLKKGAKRELTPEEWSQLSDLVNFLYDDFLTRLHEVHPALTAHDLRICCLLKISLSHEDIARIFSTTTDSLTRAKGRLKKRLNSSEYLNLDGFVSNF